MSILNFIKQKKTGEKITMVTCYDYSSAVILAKTNIDCLLVGDSLAMTMYGFKDTLSATIDMMCAHTRAVSRGAPDKFIVSDLPFLSYRKSFDHSIDAVQSLMQAGANAVKLEGVLGNEKLIQQLTESGVPVMGHLGLMPQSVHMMGGYKVQGKTQDDAMRIKEQALILQELGCFSLVLECIPAELAKEITESLTIPTIGIGAGAATDGQVLVFQDLLGLNLDFNPKFSKTFMNGHEQIKTSIENYVHAVKNQEFPSHEHCF